MLPEARKQVATALSPFKNVYPILLTRMLPCIVSLHLFLLMGHLNFQIHNYETESLLWKVSRAWAGIHTRLRVWYICSNLWPLAQSNTDLLRKTSESSQAGKKDQAGSKKTYGRAEETAQWLPVGNAPGEEPSLVPAHLSGGSQPPVTPIAGPDHLWPPWTPALLSPPPPTHT